MIKIITLLINVMGVIWWKNIVKHVRVLGLDIKNIHALIAAQCIRERLLCRFVRLSVAY